MSSHQKRRQRKRLRIVDGVVATVTRALARQGEGTTTRSIERWHAEMPREEEMVPRDKYTMFARYEKKYRKGLHSMFPSCSDEDAFAGALERM